MHRRLVGLVLSAAIAAPTLSAQVSQPLDSATVAAFRWRSIGPSNMAGRVTDIEGIPSPSHTFFVAAAAGGIWKTTNGGSSFRPVFDNQRVISMGDLAIAPSDTNIIWAGTGEEDSRNSISPGGGIYKSTDGGLTWKHMGLTETQSIGRIVVHPTNPNIVYVAALGHIWGPNPERGLYKTSDGGQTWELIKYVSEKAGAVDVAMDPTNPDVLFASTWERVRGPYFLKSGGPGSALWKTTDAGKTWTEVKGGGFPESMKGRINIAIAASNAKMIYTMVEADTAPNPQKPSKDSASKKSAQVRPSGLYRSTDGGATWTKMNNENTRPFYYSQVRVDPKNPDRVYWSSTPVKFSDDGGKTARNATVGIHVDHHAMWIDPNDPNHFIVGNDGGIAQTFDRGGNYDFINTFAIGQFYAVSYDMSVPYRVCGGLQDNGSWCGPSRRKSGPILNAMWATVGGGDGFYTAQDATDPDLIYSESQGGNIGRMRFSTGERVALQKPNWRERYRTFEDSIIIERPDTTQPQTSAQKKRIAELHSRATADSTQLDLRWNWNTPFFLSPHSSAVLYAGANRVMKSSNHGDNLQPISPDLTTQDTMRIRVSTKATGGITPDNTGAETHSTITSLAESPMRAGILYAGTDDGNIWVSKNDGGNWDNLTGRFPGVPAKTWVNRIEPSAFDSATFYVAFDNHRENDFTPYLFVTTDFGKTFTSLVNNLPTGGPDFVHVIREDPHHRDLLFVGTDVGAYVSTNRGKSWQRFMSGLPTVPVHDLKIHPRDHELIAGTHGRAIWIVDIAPLEQLTDQVLADSAHLFKPKTAFQWGEPPVGGEELGHKVFRGQSAQYGAEIAYRLTSGQRSDRTKLVITDIKGDTIQTLNGPGGPGLHRVNWNFQGKRPPAPKLGPAARRDSVVFARRVDFVFDSLEKAGQPKPMLDRVKGMIQAGDVSSIFAAFGGGGGGGGQAAPTFAERPGESRAGAAGGGRGAESQGEGAGGEAGALPDQGMMGQLMQALRPPGGGFEIPGLSRRNQSPSVPPGDYLVTLTVGGKTYREVLHVERVSGTGAASALFEEN